MSASTRLLNALQIGDEGTSLEITIREADGVALDLSDAVCTLLLESPAGGAKELAQVAFDIGGDYDGSDGVVKFLTESDTFDAAGRWRLQVYLELDTGWTGHSSIGEVLVNDNLERATP